MFRRPLAIGLSIRSNVVTVIRVVPRDPGTIIVIKTDNDETRSTQGHRWWVAGKGWVMAAELEPGMNLHTATGTTRIKEVHEDAEQPTFNLVVDEYHTYFVGKDRVLSFDNVDSRPTFRRVRAMMSLPRRTGRTAVGRPSQAVVEVDATHVNGCFV